MFGGFHQLVLFDWGAGSPETGEKLALRGGAGGGRLQMLCGLDLCPTWPISSVISFRAYFTIIFIIPTLLQPALHKAVSFFADILNLVQWLKTYFAENGHSLTPLRQHVALSNTYVMVLWHYAQFCHKGVTPGMTILRLSIPWTEQLHNNEQAIKTVAITAMTSRLPTILGWPLRLCGKECKPYGRIT
ncbi:hypothetical protein GQ44DRAFT_444690 [Phaeosphaeriaceae sp. PMI808]|nr:hypothetical protein GQ44DRAFT_444690 [Phaeosphaeriaceae sp. PMI808]